MNEIRYVGPDGRPLHLAPEEVPPPGSRIVGPMGRVYVPPAETVQIEGGIDGNISPDRELAQRLITRQLAMDKQFPREDQPPIRFYSRSPFPSEIPPTQLDVPPQMAAQEDRSILRHAADWLAAVSGQMPFADEISGAARGTERYISDKLAGRETDLRGHIYNSIDQFRDNREQYAKDNPGADNAAMGVAMLLQGAPRATANAVAFGARQLAQHVIPGVKQAAQQLLARNAAMARVAPTPLAPRVRKAFLSAAGTGALDAAGGADNGTLEDRARAAMTGGLVSGGINAVIPLFGAGSNIAFEDLSPAVQAYLRKRAAQLGGYNAIMKGLEFGGGIAAGELTDKLQSQPDK